MTLPLTARSLGSVLVTFSSGSVKTSPRPKGRLHTTALLGGPQKSGAGWENGVDSRAAHKLLFLTLPLCGSKCVPPVGQATQVDDMHDNVVEIIFDTYNIMIFLTLLM